MAAIRSRGNKSTEGALLFLLRKNKITGWRRHYKRLPGTPDFAFPEKKLAIFTDGCFWHGCPKCGFHPESNANFWKTKIESNKQRDLRNKKEIRKRGWKVIRIWEHELKNNQSRVLNSIEKTVG